MSLDKSHERNNCTCSSPVYDSCVMSDYSRLYESINTPVARVEDLITTVDINGRKLLVHKSDHEGQFEQKVGGWRIPSFTSASDASGFVTWTTPYTSGMVREGEVQPLSVRTRERRREPIQIIPGNNVVPTLEVNAMSASQEAVFMGYLSKYAAQAANAVQIVEGVQAYEKTEQMAKDPKRSRTKKRRRSSKQNEHAS